ncbi:MAG TPA: peptide chain release factor 1 [Caldisericia bacterium]|nr:peptide chain release factor 1 [Caldisericia bacterium]
MNAIDKLEQLKIRYDEIVSKLSSEEVLSNQDLLIRLSKEEAELKDFSDLYRQYQALLEDISTFEHFLDESRTSNEQDSSEEILSEIEQLKEQKIELEEKIHLSLLPKDPSEDRDVILEIRGAAGGDEAALFCADLFKMYMSFADSKGWKTELLSSHPTGLGGFKEIIVAIKGKHVYYHLMFESGVHRVQRVPDTESSGRIHTSTSTVAVLPEMEEKDFEIRQEDLKIDTFCASGHGGQNVQKNETAVRITHIPSGVAVACQDERSQGQNRERAMTILRSRLFDIQKQKKEQEEAQTRKTQVGWGDRSEKIRTYNYPQNRVTDHRIGLTLYNLQEIMCGKLDEFVLELRKHYDQNRREQFGL